MLTATVFAVPTASASECDFGLQLCGDLCIPLDFVCCDNPGFELNACWDGQICADDNSCIDTTEDAGGCEPGVQMCNGECFLPEGFDCCAAVGHSDRVCSPGGACLPDGSCSDGEEPLYLECPPDTKRCEDGACVPADAKCCADGESGCVSEADGGAPDYPDGGAPDFAPEYPDGRADTGHQPGQGGGFGDGGVPDGEHSGEFDPDASVNLPSAGGEGVEMDGDYACKQEDLEMCSVRLCAKSDNSACYYKVNGIHIECNSCSESDLRACVSTAGSECIKIPDLVEMLGCSATGAGANANAWWTLLAVAGVLRRRRSKRHPNT